ncbi:MAG: DEAD/DEAH box helicase [Thiobacillus sp.]|nr:DEAD/DEAH box helicase [Thiobacillus sp.]
MDWLAHSAKGGYPAQTYADHVGCAVSTACCIAAEASHDLPQSAPFVETVGLGTEFHDLGKLDEDNQSVLASPTGKALPHEHVDAGTKHLFGLGTDTSKFAGMLAYAHHRGLPDVPDQKARGATAWRGDEKGGRFDPTAVIARTSTHLGDYLHRHHEALARSPTIPNALTFKPAALDLRMALGCLVDADHSDTARNYGAPPIAAPLLQAEARLAALDAYVAALKFGDTTREAERAENRRAHYAACRAADTAAALVECDSPVGSGKTTAVMAHLLRAAQAKNLRRAFVVQPFTNIIDQSVDTYRKALVLPNEIADQVIAAHHHKTDFTNPLTRALTTRWHAPVVVTTAVQFFETLASNHPANLRKLHQVARSAIFIDEAHAALPAHLWPLAWQWLRRLVDHWGCHIVLASGSLARFWMLDEFYPRLKDAPPPRKRLPTPLVGTALRAQLGVSETHRIRYRQHHDALDLDALLDFLTARPGPRIAVFNTVQTAAVVARALAVKSGRGKVEHLSTALTPHDREKTLARIKARLADKDDQDWTLVATSLVEAGVDLSFRSGVREAASLASLLQLGGRVNRHNEYDEAEVWSVTLRQRAGIRQNPAMRASASTLEKLFKRDRVTPDACTEALKLEVREQGNPEQVDTLFNMESAKQFVSVADNFKVIASDTVTVLMPGSFLDAIQDGARPDWKSLQSHCVQIWATKKIDFGLAPIDAYPGLFAWNLAYDDFIGYMAGALDVCAVKSGKTLIV